MGNFIATAYIKVETLDRRNEIKNILTANGRRKFNVNPDSNKYIILNSLSSGRPIWMTSPVHHTNPDFIDCNHYANGDEDLAVDLFLALAEMRDDTSEDQWHYNTDRDFYYQYQEDGYIGCAWTCKKLTPLELAEAVQSGAITKEQLCK